MLVIYVRLFLHVEPPSSFSIWNDLPQELRELLLLGGYFDVLTALMLGMTSKPLRLLIKPKLKQIYYFDKKLRRGKKFSLPKAIAKTLGTIGAYHILQFFQVLGRYWKSLEKNSRKVIEKAFEFAQFEFLEEVGGEWEQPRSLSFYLFGQISALNIAMISQHIGRFPRLKYDADRNTEEEGFVDIIAEARRRLGVDVDLDQFCSGAASQGFSSSSIFHSLLLLLTPLLRLPLLLFLMLLIPRPSESFLHPSDSSLDLDNVVNILFAFQRYLDFSLSNSRTSEERRHSLVKTICVTAAQVGTRVLDRFMPSIALVSNASFINTPLQDGKTVILLTSIFKTSLQSFQEGQFMALIGLMEKHRIDWACPEVVATAFSCGVKEFLPFWDEKFGNYDRLKTLLLEGRADWVRESIFNLTPLSMLLEVFTAHELTVFYGPKSCLDAVLYIFFRYPLQFNGGMLEGTTVDWKEFRFIIEKILEDTRSLSSTEAKLFLPDRNLSKYPSDAKQKGFPLEYFEILDLLMAKELLIPLAVARMVVTCHLPLSKRVDFLERHVRLSMDLAATSGNPNRLLSGDFIYGITYRTPPPPVIVVLAGECLSQAEEERVSLLSPLLPVISLLSDGVLSSFLAALEKEVEERTVSKVIAAQLHKILQSLART